MNVKEKELHQIPKQKIKLNEINFDDYILDIGGGGEGVISRLQDNRVISIDKEKRELIEAQKPSSDSLGILMDATDLNFFNGTFGMVTSFFTLMYIPDEDREEVFKEIHRVLREGGVFEIWDVEIPSYGRGKEKIFVVPLEINLPNEVIETGYGVRWRGHEQDMGYYSEMATKKGFEVIKKENKNQFFHLTLKKT